MVTEERIIDIIKSIVEDESIVTNLDSDTDLLENEILDSLSLMMLVTRLEEEFTIGEFEADDIIPENFSTVNAILKLVKNTLKLKQM